MSLVITEVYSVAGREKDKSYSYLTFTGEYVAGINYYRFNGSYSPETEKAVLEFKENTTLGMTLGIKSDKLPSASRAKQITGFVRNYFKLKYNKKSIKKRT